jgi:heme exporter protein D
MTWVFIAVGVVTAGLVVLAAVSVRVLVAARGLGREIARSRQRLEPAESELRANVSAIHPSHG